MDTNRINALEDAGYTVKTWEGRETRYYLVDSYGQDAGYLVDGDDGSTGTCRKVSRRAGYIKGILRGAK